jgi:hypothetical protein
MPVEPALRQINCTSRAVARDAYNPLNGSIRGYQIISH